MRILTLFFVAIILHNRQFAWAGAQEVSSQLEVNSASSAVHMTAAGSATQTGFECPTKQLATLCGRSQRVSLPKLVCEAMAVHFNDSRYESLDQLIAATPVCPEYKQPAGLFVTLSRHGQTRACWGSIYPTNQDLVAATVRTTEAALTREYRYKHIRPDEWQSLKPQVTIVRSVEPIADLSQQNALKYGLFVRFAGRGAVLLPGEVVDAHYQLTKCKLKAGIPLNQPCQLYRIRADVLK